MQHPFMRNIAAMAQGLMAGAGRQLDRARAWHAIRHTELGQGTYHTLCGCQSRLRDHHFMQHAIARGCLVHIVGAGASGPVAGVMAEVVLPNRHRVTAYVTCRDAGRARRRISFRQPAGLSF